MSGDLISLRMLLICAVPSEQDLWRQGVALASVPIEFATADAAGAGKILAKGGVDICVIDSKLPNDDKEVALNAARGRAGAVCCALGAEYARTPRGQRRHTDQAREPGGRAQSRRDVRPREGPDARFDRRRFRDDAQYRAQDSLGTAIRARASGAFF